MTGNLYYIITDTKCGRHSLTELRTDSASRLYDEINKPMVVGVHVVDMAVDETTRKDRLDTLIRALHGIKK